MQVSFSKPTAKQLDPFLAKQAKRPYSYSAVMGTQLVHVADHDNDYNSIELGKGDTCWENAKTALRNWQQFPGPWTSIYPKQAALKEGTTVAVLLRLFGFWWTNSARIVYAFDEPDRFGFAYGTLPGHVESGEECFWLERNAGGVVSYHIRAFSRPAYWLIKIAYPLARVNQKRFARESLQHMRTFAQGEKNRENA